jgi:hypothetical protein
VHCRVLSGPKIIQTHPNITLDHRKQAPQHPNQAIMGSVTTGEDPNSSLYDLTRP